MSLLRSDSPSAYIDVQRIVRKLLWTLTSEMPVSREPLNTVSYAVIRGSFFATITVEMPFNLLSYVGRKIRMNIVHEENDKINEKLRVYDQ